MMPSPLGDLIAQLQHCKDKSNCVPKDMANRINAVAAKAIETMTKEAGEFLHFSLNDEKHTEEEVMAIIDVFPGSLSTTRGRDSCLPIHCASTRKESISFVPLLAKEGIRLGVGGEGMRGGLLVRENSTTLLQKLSFEDYYDDKASLIEYDGKCRKALEQLHEMDLLKKEDVKNFDLLVHSLCLYSRQRFEMIAALDPDLLITTRAYDEIEPLIHVSTYCPEEFEFFLKIGMKHFPERLGLLFQKYEHQTACEIAFERMGADKAMPIICRCIPRGENHPILHVAAEVAPLLEDDLIKYYQDEAFTRDTTGRTLSQVKFHSSLRHNYQTFTFEDTASFFVNAMDDQIEAKDPHSGLYPFMMVASSNVSDLGAVNYLLRRCPKVLSELMNIGNGTHTRTLAEQEGIVRGRKRQCIAD